MNCRCRPSRPCWPVTHLHAHLLLPNCLKCSKQPPLYPKKSSMKKMKKFCDISCGEKHQNQWFIPQMFPMIVLTNWTLQPRNLTNFEIDMLDINNQNRETGSIITILRSSIKTKTIMLMTGIKPIALFVIQKRITLPSALPFHLLSVP